MKISNYMNREIGSLMASRPIREAAEIMAQRDIGLLVVMDGDRPVGLVTDRDIAVRAVARGKSMEMPVQTVMTSAIHYCREDEDAGDVLEEMAHLQLRRMLVVNAERKLAGIVSIADLAMNGEAYNVGIALGQIVKPRIMPAI